MSYHDDAASLLGNNGSFSSLDDFNYTPEPGNALEYALNFLKCLIGMVGAIGNGLVCVVIWKVRREQNYTNSLIVSQSVIDFLTSLLLIANVISVSVGARPPDNYVLGVLYCIFWHNRVILFSCWAISTFNLTAIAIERYLAIIHPIWYHQNFTRKHAWILATLAWLIAPIMQTVYGARSSRLEGERCEAAISPKDKVIVGVLTFFWDFFIPLCIMAFSFTRIMVRFYKMKKPSTGDDGELQRKMRRKNVTKTLATVFVLYFVCWTPEQITFLQFNLGGQLDFGGAWHTIALILATSNSAVNPFVYALRFKQYKEELRSLFSKLKDRQK